MPRLPRKASTLKASNAFLDALQFLSSITTNGNTPYEKCVLLKDKFAIASNGNISAGCPIEEEIYAAPTNSILIEALKKCGNEFALTQNEEKLSIKSGKFKAIIPCIDPSPLFLPIPDPPQIDIDDNFKIALASIDCIKEEANENRIINHSFLMNGQSVLATDGKILIEYWHGLNLPVGPPVPKAIIPTINKSLKKLSKFGCSNSSATFYFEDGSWVKSQLYAGQWPDISKLINKTSNPFPIPKDFFHGLEAVSPFSINGFVYFDNGILKSHFTELLGASFEIEGLPKGPAYSHKYLSILKDRATLIDFVNTDDAGHYMLYFFGDKLRGIVMGVG